MTAVTKRRKIAEVSFEESQCQIAFMKFQTYRDSKYNPKIIEIIVMIIIN